jgi:REP element-mobilizing transposase RayT
MAGIINGKNQKPIIVNGVVDHVHIFVGLKPTMTISELVRDIKTIRATSSTTTTSLKGGFLGRRAMALFLMRTLK